MVVKLLIAAFQTNVLGKLAPVEKAAVESAQRAFREGWLCEDPATKFAAYAVPEVDRRLMHFLVELDSGDPKRQRAVLADAEFQASVAREYERARNLASMFYFQDLAKDGSVRLKEAIDRADADYKLFQETEIAKPGPEGEALRAKHFASLEDDDDRLAAARFCAAFGSAIALVPHTYEPGSLSDEKLRGDVIEECIGVLASIEDDIEYELARERMERLSGQIEPLRITHYTDIFKRPDWNERTIQGRELVKQLRQNTLAEAEAERLEAERKAAAERERVEAAQRKKLEAQLTFRVEDETLDVSIYCWPRLNGDENMVALFNNIRTAFSAAKQLRFTYLPSYGQIMVERSIGSMSARQLACVKHQLWTDRMGYLEDQKYLGEPSIAAARMMIDLLNADGRAWMFSRNKEYEEFKPMMKEVAAQLKGDIDQEWLLHADTFQKLIGAETFGGEWAKWMVEDPQSNAGWASSR